MEVPMKICCARSFARSLTHSLPSSWDNGIFMCGFSSVNLDHSVVNDLKMCLLFCLSFSVFSLFVLCILLASFCPSHYGLKLYEIDAGPFTCPLAHSLAPHTHSLAPHTHSLSPHCSLRLRAPLRSFICSLARPFAPELMGKRFLSMN